MLSYYHVAMAGLFDDLVMLSDGALIYGGPCGAAAKVGAAGSHLG